jgi:hypothetical protein
VFFKWEENVFISKTSCALHVFHPVFKGAPTILMANKKLLLSGQLQSTCASRPLTMGNSGGDPRSGCENTVEATEAGLKAGMNAVR